MLRFFRLKMSYQSFWFNSGFVRRVLVKKKYMGCWSLAVRPMVEFSLHPAQVLITHSLIVFNRSRFLFFWQAVEREWKWILIIHFFFILRAAAWTKRDAVSLSFLPVSSRSLFILYYFIRSFFPFVFFPRKGSITVRTSFSSPSSKASEWRWVFISATSVSRSAALSPTGYRRSSRRRSPALFLTGFPTCFVGLGKRSCSSLLVSFF